MLFVRKEQHQDHQEIHLEWIGCIRNECLSVHSQEDMDENLKTWINKSQIKTNFGLFIFILQKQN